MPWPLHVAKAYYSADESTKKSLIDVALASGWGTPDETIAVVTSGEQPKLLRSLPLAQKCVHNKGKHEDARPGCGYCNSIACDIKGKAKLSDCVNCTDWKSKLQQTTNSHEIAIGHKHLAPKQAIKFDHTNLAPATGGFRGNPSIIAHQDGYVFAYRNSWGAANVSVIRLNKDFVPIGRPKQLALNHPLALSGREDPRLFWHKGKIHVWYTGWMGGDDQRRKRPRWIASVLFARLNNNSLEVEDIFCPNIPKRNRWEKNHSYFDYQGETHCVYSIVPHRVMNVYCEEVKQVYETPTVTSWPYRYLRGGASPVLHNGEYYHFFHGMEDRSGVRLYSIGVAAFEAKPPFKITRITNRPLDVADKNPRGTGPKFPDVIFPGGAVFVDGQWVVACGIHDAWSEIRFYPEAMVEELLEPI